MKAYLIITGTIFALLSLLHIWEVIVEWGRRGAGPVETSSMMAIVVLTAALSAWAWNLLRNVSKNNLARTE